jgi:RNA polymerase sporulation-specific sigma factor
MVNDRSGSKKQKIENATKFVDIVFQEVEIKKNENKIKLINPVGDEEDEDPHAESSHHKHSPIENILFKLPMVKDPIIGTPKQVQKELDSIVKKMQKNLDTKESRHQFDRIHLYMHGYLINIVLKQFPYIKGMQTVDIYQQTLYALWMKAIPGFKRGKGMSFLNFAKMCIRRHLITQLNASKNRQKDQSLNRAISLDSPVSYGQSDEESNNTFSNTVPDSRASTDELTAAEEALRITKEVLFKILSDFEKIVLHEYLSTSTYKEIAKNIAQKTNKPCETKSVDNALLRIRKKAIHLKNHSKIDDIPLFIV